MLSSFCPNSRVVARITLTCSLVLTLAVSLGCDGKKNAKDAVSGKVTLNGQPVAGQVVFVGSDGKESASPIGPDGAYSIQDAPRGEVKIMVKSTGAALGGAGGPKIDDKKTPGAAGLPGTTTTGVAPPPRYGTTASPLKLTVTGGNQEHNITLDP